VRHLPNLVSLLRLLLAPVVAWMIVTRQDGVFWVFLAGALSDAVDGMLARALGVSSQLGTYLDPLADKVFVSVVTAALWWSGAMPGWLCGLILLRDLMIVVGSGWIYRQTRRRDFQPSVWGKVSTILQLCAAGAAMVFSGGLQMGFFVASAAGTIASGADYARTGWQMLNNELPMREMPPAHLRQRRPGSHGEA
jgi:cardiolipin synthase (CMP-forming)